MDFVVDANVIFSALIKSSHTRHLLITSKRVFYAPEFLFQELEEHMIEIVKKTGLDKIQLKEILKQVMIESNIKVVPANEFISFFEKASEVSPDPDDAHYFALALSKNCAIWSNDKKLKDQRTVQVYSTIEIMKNAE